MYACVFVYGCVAYVCVCVCVHACMFYSHGENGESILHLIMCFGQGSGTSLELRVKTCPQSTLMLWL